MDEGMNHVTIDLNAKQRDRKNAETIAQNSKRENGQRQNCAMPRKMKKHVATDEACYEEDEARPDAAAFVADFDNNAGKLKGESLAQDRDGRESNHQRGDVSRGVLKESFNGLSDECRKRDDKEQEAQRKRQCARSRRSPKPGHAGQNKTNKREYRKRQIVDETQRPRPAVENPADNQREESNEQRDACKERKAPCTWRKLSSFETDEVKRNEGYQGNVRV